MYSSQFVCPSENYYMKWSFWYVFLEKQTVNYIQGVIFSGDCCRAMLCMSAAYAVMRCLSVRPSRSWILSKETNISSNFFTILGFPHQMLWQCSNGDPPNENIKCTGKNCNSQSVSMSIIDLYSTESWGISTTLCVLSSSVEIGSSSVIVWSCCCWAPGHGDCLIW